MPNDSNLQVIFLTDGHANCGNTQKKVDLKHDLANVSKTRNVQSTIFCIGLSANHDASLLNYMAQMGSNIGQFKYIENVANAEKMKERLGEALGEFLGMAIQLSVNVDRFILTSESTKFNKKIDYKAENIYAKQDEDDTEEGFDLKKVATTYKASLIVKESILRSKDLKIVLFVGKDAEIDGSNEFVLNTEPELGQKCSAELALINQITFDLI